MKFLYQHIRILSSSYSHYIICDVRFYFCSNMQGNPLSCNCYLAWFAGWLRKRDIAGITGRCHDPPRLKDAVIKDIPHHEFKCNSAYLTRYLVYFYSILLYSWIYSATSILT